MRSLKRDLYPKPSPLEGEDALLADATHYSPLTAYRLPITDHRR
jgi:hypothetical protein